MLAFLYTQNRVGGKIPSTLKIIEPNYQKTGKELMSQDEITVMDGSKCIFQLRGVRPFLSDKYDITKHKNYRLLEDYDKKNLFDIESYMKRKGKGLPLPCQSQEGT